MVSMPFKDSVNRISSFIVLVIFYTANVSANKEGYYGKYIGKLSQLHHGVSGDVFAVDARTLHLRNFNYDGEGPAAYFYAGNSKGPGVGGFRLRDERGTTNVLPRYRNKHITITLPEGKTLQNIRWFSVWCDEFSVNFGDVKIPKNLDFPKPQKINGLAGVHGVSSEPIVIVDAQTLLIPSFSYDGEAPDAKFWVGRGFKPSPQGIRIPDENGKEVPLRRYDRKTIVLTLPGDLTIFDIGHFGVWCEAFTVDFGHVQIPRGLNIPPSLKMLGVSPQSKLNCEVLWDDFAYEVRWAVAGDSIVLQLVARLENNEYMSFGLSGDKGRSRMVGGDVVVAWVEKDSLKGYAQDYYLDAKSQCSGGRGSCPDENIAEGTDSVRLLNAALVNGYSIVTFQRSLKAQDEFDKPVFTNESQPIIWAIGPLNSRKEVSYHSLANRGDIFIDFGRSPKWNCPTPESTSDQSEYEDSYENNRESEETRVQDTRKQDSGRRESRPKTQIPTPAPVPKAIAWEIPAIKCYEPEDGVFYAQMGPTGGKHGYSAITGHVGWGISWYINGLLIPEINVVRGRTYTFIVEGGLDPETPARYHPFYITDDPVGGYEHKTPQERANIQIFAGAVQNKRGEVRPTGVGRLCNWTPDPNQPPADEFSSFGAYQRTLRLECDPGNPGIIQWTVDKDTPDTVYYQCYTHRYLGWKINVHDHCEGEAGSHPVPSIVKAPSHIIKSHQTDSEGSESINYETRVKPDFEVLKNMLQKNQTSLGPNEYVKVDSNIKYYPEFNAYDDHKGDLNNDDSLVNIKTQENEFGLKKEEVNTRFPQVPLQHVQPQFSQLAVFQQQASNPPELVPVAEKTLVKFQNHKAPGISSYSVKEEPLEGNVQQSFAFQNFHIVPVITPLQGSDSFQSQQLQEQVAFHQNIPEQIKNGKFGQEFLKNHQILRGQAEEKFKKHSQKLQFHTKLNNRLPNGQNSGSPIRLRKPLSNHALTLQQRPFPPGVFRPPLLSHQSGKPQKRPAALGSQKISHFTQVNKAPHSHHRLNIGHRPEDSRRQEMHKIQLLKFQQDTHKKQQESDFKQELSRPAFQSPTVLSRQPFQNIPFAHNTGFDPETVKVEGGFKPILSTGIAPKLNLVDRADVDVEDDKEEKAGTIDLVTDVDPSEKRSLFRRQDEMVISGNDEDGTQEDKKLNLFKDQKPQMFEPIFIPSFPDNSVKKFQEKHKKKPSLKYRNDQLQYYNAEKSRNVYVKIRPTANLIRRPLYPDNVVPHFKIPYYGGAPQFRYQQSEELEDEEDNPKFEVIKVNNDTINGDVNRAENILEVIEMEEDKSSQSTIAEENESKDFTLEDSIDKSSSNVTTTTDEIAMADERKDFYLPPKANRYLSYDGKVVNAEMAPALPEMNPRGDVSKLPQFVPFRGAIPPLTKTLDAKNLPQLRSSKLARHDILPPSDIPSAESTKLSAVTNVDHRESEASEPAEVVKRVALSGRQNEEKKDKIKSRKRRSPDHIPGHEGHDHHDHHFHHNSSFSSASNLLSIVFVSFTLIFVL